MNKLKKIAFLAFLITLLSCICAFGDEYQVGSGNDDWWTAYPDQSTGAGGDVIHPSWVLEALQEKPVLIYVHKSCDYCQPQTDAVKNITAEFSSQINCFEISAEGDDSRSEEALLAYDPNGGTMYVPLTVILTLSPNSEGEVVSVWHSTDEVTGDDWIRNYVQNAIDRYGEFSADWNP